MLDNVRSAARSALIRAAQDYTLQATTRSILVVAPHPDDETIGCGGRILHATRSGAAVTVVVATDGAASHDHVGTTADQLRLLRHEELIAATTRLGVAAHDVIELKHPDGGLAACEELLTLELLRIINERRPDDVYATSMWESHPDHAAAGRALRAAMAQLALHAPDERVVPRHFEYPVWLWSNWPVSKKWGRYGPRQWWTLRTERRCHTVDLAEVAEQKWSAMQAYASQLGDAVDGVQVGLPPLLLERAKVGPELFFEIV